MTNDALITIRLPATLKAQLVKEAAQEKKTLGQYPRELLE